MYTNISKNKKARIKGHENKSTIQLFGLEKIKNNCEKIKKGNHKFILLLFCYWRAQCEKICTLSSGRGNSKKFDCRRLL